MGGRKWLAVLGYGTFSSYQAVLLHCQHVGVDRWRPLGRSSREGHPNCAAGCSGGRFGEQRYSRIGVWFSPGNGYCWRNAGDTHCGASSLDSAEEYPGSLQIHFPIVVLVSLIPAFLAVLSLAVGAKDVPVKGKRNAPKLSLRGMGNPFIVFLVIVSIFTLGNSSDAFLVLRAQNLGISVTGILIMLVMFNLIYSLVSVPAGSLSDRIGRRRLIIGGWLVYAVIYLGFAFAQAAWQVWLLYVAYGLYYGMAYGTANALVADLVPEHLRGTAYGTYNAIIGILAFPASFIAGLLWQGAGVLEWIWPFRSFLIRWTLALIAALLMAFWMPKSVYKINRYDCDILWSVIQDILADASALRPHLIAQGFYIRADKE